MVDRTSGIPAFRQVAADLREKITTGHYAPEARLPSERELVEHYGVSRPTIRDALDLLRGEGMVIALHGKGVFVRPRARIQRITRSRLSRTAREANKGAFLADAAEHGFVPSTTVDVRFEPAEKRIAKVLGIQTGDEITVRDRVMRGDGVVLQLAVSRLPRALTRGTSIEEPDTGPGGSYARLEEAGHRIASFVEHVAARMPTPGEVSALQLGQGIPVLTVTRIAYRVDGQPLEVNDMTLPADRYERSYEWAAE